MRKHLSAVKGGQLARLAAPATVINLMLSDVVGDDMATIASGPFVPDPSTFDEVAFIMAKYKLMKKIPSAVRNHLKKGLTDQIPETPKADEAGFKKVTNLVVGSNLIALKAAQNMAKEIGYRTLILSSMIEGETREVAKVHTGPGQGGPSLRQSDKGPGLHYFRRRNHGNYSWKRDGGKKPGIRLGRRHGNRPS